MDDRTSKLRVAMIKERLLRGVPPSSTVWEIVQNMSDDEIIRKDDEATALKVERIAARSQKQKLVGKIVA